MKHLRSYRAIVAIAMMLIGWLPSLAHDFEVDGIYYSKINSSKVEVTYQGTSLDEYTDEYAGNIVIPETITYSGTTYSVTSIGEWSFYGCSSLTSVTIPNSVTSIEICAFHSCSGLTSVTIPNSVTSIGGGAFYGCNGLTNVTIPNSVASIGEQTFFDCRGLTSVTIPNSVTNIGDYAFCKCTGLESIIVESGNTKYDSREECNAIIETASNTLIAGCKNSKIPNSITSIGYCAFENCSGLISITIPNSVTSIRDYAFSGCSGLTSVTISNSIKSIGNEVFYGCSSLISVIVGSSVTSIKDDAFYGCNIKKVIWLTNTPPKGYENLSASINYVANDQYTSLSNVTIYPYLSSLFEVDGLKYVPVSPSERTCDAIDCSYSTNAENLTIGNTVTYKGMEMTVKDIKPYICYGNKFIKNITVNHNANIPNYSFFKCSGLTSATIGDNVTSIGNYAFSHCTGLKSVIIGKKVTSIGNSVFYGCSGLTSVAIPNSVTSIGNEAFYDCVSLIELLIEDGKSTLSLGYNYKSSATGEGLFHDCPLKTLYLGRNLSYNTSKNYGYSPFYKITKLKSVTIGNNVTSIGNSLFYGCSGLASVIIGNSVTSIGNSVFYGCSGLTSLTIPNSVTSIGNEVFDGCTSIIELRIEDGKSTLSLGYKTTTLEGLFHDLPLVTLYLGRNLSYDTSKYFRNSLFYKKNTLKSVTIGNSVTTIDKSAFYGCSNLASVIIGNSVTSIGNEGFYGCTNLASVIIGNSVKNIEDYAFYECESLTNITIPNSVTSIGDYAFYGCEGLTNIEIPNSVTDIWSYAFSGCVSLTNVSIPNSVTDIWSYAFFGCESLTNVTIPNSVTLLADGVFSNCRSLKSVSIGTGIIAINEYTFNACSSLLEINIPSNVKIITNNVFKGCKSLVNVTIDDRETELSLGSNGSSPMFADCPLNTVYIGGRITYDKSSSKGYSPFYRNTTLRTVIITDKEIEIYDNEFYGCTNLKDVRIGDGVTNIGNWAFSGCSNLDYFAFGTNVKNIGKEAFSDCVNVVNIISYSVKPPECGTQALDDINKWNCTLKVLDKSVAAYQSANQWKEFFFIESLPIEGKVATPIIKLENKTITITSETPKATIYYTLDGTNPTAKSTLYSGPFALEKNCTIKAVATRINYENSEISVLEATNIKIDATSISLDKTEVSLKATETAILVATVLPELTTNKSVTWTSSNEAVATVDANGVVTAIALGEAVITATTTDGTNLSASCKVTVVPNLATSIELDKTEISLEATETATLVAIVLPELTTNKSVTWTSSNEAVATVDANGVVTAVAVGEAVITATTTDGTNLSASCKVTVVPTLATSIELDKTEISLEATETVTLVATVLPELTTNKSVVWTSSNEAVATVDAYGVVTAIAVGEAIITATTTDGSNLSATCKVTVVPTLAETITLDKTEISLEATETATLVASVLPELTTNKSVVWTSSNEAVATVDANGVVTANALGEAIITATTTDGSNLSATCKVTVVPTLATSIELDKTEISLEATETATLVATVLPELTTNKSVTWTSSNEAVATVDANGVVTAIAVGEATITAITTDGTNLSASCKVIVVPTLAETITLDKTEISLEATETATLVATVLPELTTNKSVEWSSSNEAVAEVDENGVVTAVAVGEATITAITTDGSNLSATCKVIVIPTLAVSIELDKTEASVEEKSDLQLTATILPENATNKEVAWRSSDNLVATVDNTGLVTIHSAGEVIITATTTDGSNLSATCRINVYSGINGVNGDDVIVATVGDNIVVKNAKLGSVVNVYASNGALIASKEATDGSVVVEAPIKGIYVVTIDGKSFKVMVK